jgi:hypothetical protein
VRANAILIHQRNSQLQRNRLDHLSRITVHCSLLF